MMSGVVLLIVSILIGLSGTIWGIFSSFDALRFNENAGIGAVGDGIRNALVSTIVSIIGSAIGVIIIIVGAIKCRRAD